MTKIIHMFPVRRTAPLWCVWIKTGNPAQPLVCKWTSRQKIDAALVAAGTDEPASCQLCA
ncbi:MAG: hypothetical protein ACP5E2_05930 [Terracidiphilus sp.]